MESTVSNPVSPLSFRISLQYSVLVMTTVLFFLSALEGYTIFSVPIQWLAQVGFVFVAVLIILITKSVIRVPGFAVFFSLFVWLLFVTMFNMVSTDYYSKYDSLESATTPFNVFILLRFVSLVSTISAIYVVYWLSFHYRYERLSRIIVTIGAVVALIAIYYFIAERIHLPYIPRTRVGSQMMVSEESFWGHMRATGTFREPSHLAIWLLVPLTLSMVASRRIMNLKTVIMGLVFLTTFSLTGFIGIISGVVGALIIRNPLRLSTVRKVIKASIILIIVFFFANAGFEKVTGGLHSLDDMVVHRIMQIVEGGVEKSNRAEYFNVLSDYPPPLFGFGLGLSHIAVSTNYYHRTSTVMGFLSVYFNMLYSGGWFGFALLVIALVTPLWFCVTSAKLRSDNIVFFLLIAYCANLAAFAVAFEEFDISFGIIFALLVSRLKLLLRT